MITKCDRCGKTEPEPFMNIETREVNIPIQDTRLVGTRSQSFDLCARCAVDFKAWIDGEAEERSR